MRHRLLSFTTTVLVALFIVAFVNAAHAARLAVVIGNDQYQYHPKLRKAGNDADAMAALFKRAGFTVVNDGKRRDLTGIQITQALGRLVDAVREGDEVVVFYSGHGLQYGDVSILTGTDLPSPAERYVALHSGIQLKQWQNRIQAQKARFALFVVDACREDLTDDGVVRSVNLGADTIAVAPPPKGQLVIYSASSGQFALDRLGNADPNPNGVFTRVFLEEAQKPGVSILDVLGETEERVQRLAATYVNPRSGLPHEQTPASRNEWSVRGKFCFFSQGGQCGAVTPNAVPPPVIDAEQLAWDAVQQSRTVGAYRAYLSEYPHGRYATVARVSVAGSIPVTPAQEVVRFEARAEAREVLNRAGEVFKDCADCPEMVVLPAGRFVMGNEEFNTQKPSRTVGVNSFALGKTEVTQRQWRLVMGTNPSGFQNCGDDCPVERVSWNDAQDYIKKLNAKTNQRYRLPTEAEWEYAARAGTNTKWSHGDDDGSLDRYAWSRRNSGEQTRRVAQKLANPFGLHDMHGNVAEWVEDCFHENYMDAPIDGTAWTASCPRVGEGVLRGGTWQIDPIFSRSANRSPESRDTRYFSVGFRIARSF